MLLSNIGWSEFHFFQAIKKLSSGFWRLSLRSILAKFEQDILMFDPATIDLYEPIEFSVN